MARGVRAVVSVSATVKKDCLMRSDGPMKFGEYRIGQKGPLKVEVSPLQISCTKGSTVFIALDGGLNPKGRHRYMEGPKHTKVRYQIYLNGHSRLAWNELHQVKYVARTVAFTPIKFYGEVPGKQTPLAGHYHDTLVATVNF
ncbi:MAG TPA: spore coat U domain-containing protein [Candidatus Baltobacteraceae bacterium]|jgi:spore coat protein U-like protein